MSAPETAAESIPETESLSGYTEREGEVEELRSLCGGTEMPLYGTPVSPQPHVDPRNAMRLVAVYTAVRVLAEAVASLPVHLFSRDSNGVRERQRGDRLEQLLNLRPNPYTRAFTFRETVMSQALLWGNGYAEIEEDGRGDPINLWPITASRVRDPFVTAQGVLVYPVDLPSNDRGLERNPPQAFIPSWRMIHVPALGFDGVRGLSPIGWARQAVGLGLSAQDFGARLFGSGANTKGVLEHPGKLSASAQQNLREQFEANYAGLSNAHRTMILEEGMKYSSTSIPPEDAQFLETRKFQVVEIARLYRVPPHMLADLEGAKFNNVEHLGIEFVRYSLLPWLQKQEQEYDLKLLRSDGSRFLEHQVNALMRGDTTTRFAAYSQGIQDGWLSRNEVRAMENLNAVEGLDTYDRPLNFEPIAEDDDSRSQDRPQVETRERAVRDEEREKRSVRTRLKGRRELEKRMAKALSSVVSLESNFLRRRANRLSASGDLTAFLQDVTEFYAQDGPLVGKFDDQLRDLINTSGLMAAGAVGEEIGRDIIRSEETKNFIDSYVRMSADNYAANSRRSVEGALADVEDPEDPGSLADAVKTTVGLWAGVKALNVASALAVRTENQLSRRAYMDGGVTQLRWVTNGDENCPYCDEMDGRIVGVERSFVTDGQGVDADGGTMRVTRNVKTPPLHDGCDCSIVGA